ncbi:hypothetical protein HYW87_05050 [Candidatus Roizmanbacteria bacterium]|nr:hypothetical protein [Candidatus Roizmanbacteria bacterium]
MNSYRNAAIKILKKSNKPLHYREISDKSIKEKLLSPKGRTPWATMNAILSTDVARYRDNSFFRRTTPGFYILNKDKITFKRQFGASITKTQYKYSKEGNFIDTATKKFHFTTPTTLTSKQKGDLAEARVIELITLYGDVGLSCYKPVSDDEGIDIIVKRRGKLDILYIQVKSTFGYPPTRGFVSTVKEKNIHNKSRIIMIFVFFDLTSGDLFDNIFCIPAPEFLKLTENEKKRTGNRVFTVSLNRPEKSKYAEFMIEKRELSKRIIEIMDRL